MYKNLAQYPQETPFNCQTQVVYDIDQAITFSEKAKCLGKPILMGIMPLKSVKMDRYMKDQVEGIDIPDEDAENIKTVQNAIEYVEAHLN